MKSLMVTTLVAGLVIFTGCSNKELYDSFQYDRKSGCEKLPETERSDCMIEYEKSYDQYKREQGELEKK